MLAGLTLTLFLGTWLQQLGLVTTEAGTAGFITGLYVVFTPLLGLLIGYRVRLMTWIASIIAVAGLFLLTVAGRPDLNIGDLMVLLSAIAWGGQLLFMGWLAPRMHPLVLTVTHLGGAGLLALIVTPFFESVTLAGLLAAKWNILFSALLATSLAFLLQAWAQRDAPPAHAAILISLEAVFAVLFGWWLLSESLSNTQIIGCGVMLTAILMAQIKPPRQAFCAQDDDTPIPPRP
jgi:drug/metabolite transporter (DMT)-like permease